MSELIEDIILTGIADTIKRKLPPGTTWIHGSAGPPESIKIRFFPPKAPNPPSRPLFAFPPIPDYDDKSPDGINLIIEAPGNNPYYKYTILTRTKAYDLDQANPDFEHRASAHL